MDLDSPLHLGCPGWNVPKWRGHLLPPRTLDAEFLPLYSQVFNAVEGNTTHYALPTREKARRWASCVRPGFQFCCKVHKDISHGPGLLANAGVLREFIAILEILAAERVLGPTFLQVSARYGPDRFEELERFCLAWPADFPLAVEVRHRAFYSGGERAQALTDLLAKHGMDRVVFDSRALFQSGPEDAAEQEAQRKKAKVPICWEATGKRPFLRLIGRNKIGKCDPWLREAAGEVKRWLDEGRHPYVFMHAPDDFFAPALCERFHGFLKEAGASLPPLDVWKANPAHTGDLFGG